MLRSSLILFLAASAAAENGYQKPPQAILDVLNAPATPRAIVSPDRTHILLAEPLRYPPIADLAQPMLRLAGLRINPRTNGLHNGFYFKSLVFQTVDGKGQELTSVAAGAKLGLPQWSPDSRHFSVLRYRPDSIELWIGDAATGAIAALPGLHVSAITGPAVQWLPDNHTLLVQTVPANRGRAPALDAVPEGPKIQESMGKAGPVRTYEDMLASTHDEALFEYYATAQPAFVDIATGQQTAVGPKGIYTALEASPNGQSILASRAHRPFSYLHPVYLFPKDVEVWDRDGRVLYTVAKLPLADHVPIDGVPTGPRTVSWRPTDPGTLDWVEALDGGNPKEKAPHRDRIVSLKAPFRGEPVELYKTQHRFAGLEFGERGTFAIAQDYDRTRKWIRGFLLETQKPNASPKVLWDLSAQDRYRSPGTPLTKELPNGHMAVEQIGNDIFLSGPGSSPQGDRPFLDRMNVETGAKQRIFQSEPHSYETPIAVLDETGTKLLTLRETPSDPPNFFVRNGAALRPITHIADAAPELRQIQKRLVTYQRPDGVQLSFTLYLPPGYKQGTRLPTVVWAYPLEFNDAGTAGQITGSTDRFTSIQGMSHLFFLLRGYAVLDNAAMPVVGDPDTVNNTYLEQIVADAKAAIDKAVELGVTDRDRVGVGGHSYGAFMTANLLAHSNLFRAGIARSGAYNRTLTPFGFQTERRTIWEAPEIYLRMSPFLEANKIKAPLLMIHGEADDNQGTFPIQSERMYQAIRGNGGIVRLVLLPFEAHGYQARESIEHTLFEMIAWFDKYVKGADPSLGVSTSE